MGAADEAVCERVRVHGRVQGVGFRWHTRRRARALGLAGFVRNLPDGSVEVAWRGSDEGVAALRDWLSRGPPGARVDDVQDHEGVPWAYPDFRILP